jgi:DNA polymerase-3 subunit beta
MYLTIDQAALAKALSIVGRAAARRSTLPVLSNIHLDAADGALTLAATDLALMIVHDCGLDAEIEEEGATTVPAKTLTDLVRALPAEALTLSARDRDILTVKRGKSTSTIKGIPASEFPEIPKFPAGCISVKDGVLANMVGQVALAAAKDVSRPILTGVCIQFVDDGIVMAAADGFRLAVREEAEVHVAEAVSAIVPARAMAEVARFDGDVDMAIDGGKVFFCCDGTMLVSQIIEGRFPDYAQIIPWEHSTSVCIRAQALIDIVRTASIFAREAANIVKLSFRDDVLEVSATSVETGDHVEVLGLDGTLEGDDIDIAFNAQYLVDALRSMGTDAVSMELGASSAPCVLHPVDGADLTHVIMPIHIS